mmetsp:Transcript_27969/g.70790  ORF Transcript_27969/g.70790 Transcript_27969/m.70790 type:complete len:228 (+) Transcript_27969:2-685(+)
MNTLQRFDICAAKCSVESDRELVERNIESFVKHAGHTAEIATRAQSLVAFNSLVQQTVPDILATSLGHVGIRYKDALVISLAWLLEAFKVLCLQAFQRRSLEELALVFSFHLVYGLAVAPLILALAALVTRLCVRMPLPACVAALGGSTLAVAGVWHLACLGQCAFYLQGGAVLILRCRLARATFVAVCALLAILTHAAYGGRGLSLACFRPGAAPTGSPCTPHLNN